MDDYRYVDGDSLTASDFNPFNATSTLYDNGWIVWNGNHFGANGTASNEAQWDAVTPAAEYMVENGTAVVNTGEDGTTQLSMLDFVGYVTTPTAGYTEHGLGGDIARFHGPFQRWMTQGAITSSSKTRVVGKRVHMMRQFHCAEDES